MSTVRAAIYTRISRDRDRDGLGVARQEKDCQALASSRRWSIVEVYCDQDRSAFYRAPREQYERMLSDIRARRIDAVVAWHPDRLYRRLQDLEGLVDELETHPVEVATVKAGDIDLTSASGRLHARMLAAVARHESEHKAERLARKHLELAEGGWWKGGPRPYGYEVVRESVPGVPKGCSQLAIIPEEASIIREAASRARRGEALGSICRDLNERNVPTAQGARWLTPTLKRILTSLVVAGRREFHGVDIREARWPPILDIHTHQWLLANLNDPSRSRTPPRRVNLLTGGIAVCGLCGKPLHGQRKQSSNARILYCVPSNDKGGCGRISVAAAPLELLVTEMVLNRLDGPSLAATVASSGMADEEKAQREVMDIQAEWDELTLRLGEGELNHREYAIARRAIESRLERAKRSLARHGSSAVLNEFAGHTEALRAGWIDLTLDRRRAIVAAVLQSVEIGPAARRGPGLDPSRVHPVWRL